MSLAPIHVMATYLGPDVVISLSLHLASCSIMVRMSAENAFLIQRWQNAAAGTLYKLALHHEMPADPVATGEWCIRLFGKQRCRYLGHCLFNGSPSHVVSVKGKHKYKLYMIQGGDGHTYVNRVPADDDFSMIYYLEKGLMA